MKGEKRATRIEQMINRNKYLVDVIRLHQF